jgi:hypothetical protein
MINQLTLFIFFLAVIQIHTQEKRNIISGKINSDALSVENIHIINKNSGKATISNQYGEFKIPVKINDSLLISSIQFENKNIHITKSIISSKKLSIILFPKINQLKEIIIKKHNLSGYLKTDINNVKIENIIDQFTLQLPNAGRIPIPTIDSLDIQLGLYSKVNLDALFRRINGDFKKLKKLQKLKKEDKILENIRQSVTDKYFIEILKIPEDYISNFLHYLVYKDIVSLYRQNKKIEAVNLLIKESIDYRKFKGLD